EHAGQHVLGLHPVERELDERELPVMTYLMIEWRGLMARTKLKLSLFLNSVSLWLLRSADRDSKKNLTRIHEWKRSQGLL
ncbi:MAG: hypothetical protein Q8N51_12440, partial [Gammaproteobacteria bacterium]|nr:hypothetical protein [Gammaproteobacteria bacterium]